MAFVLECCKRHKRRLPVALVPFELAIVIDTTDPLRVVVDDCGLHGFGGSGSGLCQTPRKTGCCQNLCGGGIIFVVRASSNPEMGVEVKPSTLQFIVANNLLLWCSVDRTAVLPQCCSAAATDVHHNNQSSMS